MRFGAVVEGLGERKSVGSLVAKTAVLLGCQAYVVAIVECGGWTSLKKADGLEKYGKLVISEAECDAILYLVDLDDGCPVEEFLAVQERAQKFSERCGKPVYMILLNREYETWFLQDLINLKTSMTDVEWVEGREIADAFAIRDAKGALETHLRFTYRPSVDQEKFTKKLNLKNLARVSRSFRKLATVVTGQSYDEIDALIGI